MRQKLSSLKSRLALALVQGRLPAWLATWVYTLITRDAAWLDHYDGLRQIEQLAGRGYGAERAALVFQLVERDIRRVPPVAYGVGALAGAVVGAAVAVIAVMRLGLPGLDAQQVRVDLLARCIL